MSDEKQMAASALAASIAEEFAGVKTPVSAEHFARLYGVMAAAAEANLAVCELAMKANPRLLFDESALSARDAIQNSVHALTDALMLLARDYGLSSGRAAEE